MIELTEVVVETLDTISMINGCYDRPNEDVPFPYLTLDGYNSVSFDTKSDNGLETTLIVHSWSHSNGKTETFMIQREIMNKLHQKRLVNLDKEFLFFHLDSTVLVDPDNVTFHGVMRFQVLASV